MDVKTLIFRAATIVTLTSGIGSGVLVWGVPQSRAADGPDVLGTMKALCALKPTDTDGLRQALPDGRMLEARMDGPKGNPMRSLHRVLMPNDGEWVISRIFPMGRVLRFSLEWHEPVAGGTARPQIALIAGRDCVPTEGRRLSYGVDGRPIRLEVLSSDLKSVVMSEVIDPPVPDLAVPPADAVRVALIDTGVNYTLPLYRGRLGVSKDGALAGYDFWDMDARPFDIDTTRSPFFPLHHGTAVSSIILREAPKAVVLPYRYPRNAMARFADLVARADADGALVVNMAMGSNRRSDWAAFAQAAKDRPHMLFIVSAGNDGRDLDQVPIYPAALDLENILVVTSSDAEGRLARGSNWGAVVVDVMAPGEQVAVIDHRGAAGKASGSSFAVPRVAALAARLLAKHPEWRGPELKAAIVKRARKPFGRDVLPLRHGWIPDPTDDFEG